MSANPTTANKASFLSASSPPNSKSLEILTHFDVVALYVKKSLSAGVFTDTSTRSFKTALLSTAPTGAADKLLNMPPLYITACAGSFKFKHPPFNIIAPKYIAWSAVLGASSADDVNKCLSATSSELKSFVP